MIGNYNIEFKIEEAKGPGYLYKIEIYLNF